MENLIKALQSLSSNVMAVMIDLFFFIRHLETLDKRKLYSFMGWINLLDKKDYETCPFVRVLMDSNISDDNIDEWKTVIELSYTEMLEWFLSFGVEDFLAKINNMFGMEEK